MLTIVESSVFTAIWRDYWTEEEFGEFCRWLSVNPEEGAVIPGSGGCRKVRWSRQGTGKRGGVRVIHYSRTAEGQIWLLTMYAKSARSSVPATYLVKILETIYGKDDRKGATRARRKAKHR
jgi:hypothetical protein